MRDPDAPRTHRDPQWILWTCQLGACLRAECERCGAVVGREGDKVAFLREHRECKGEGDENGS